MIWAWAAMVGKQLGSTIRGNAIRSALLVAGFPFVLPGVLFVAFVSVLAVLGRRDAFALASAAFVYGTVVMVVVTVLWLPIGYFINQWVIDRATGARLLARNELPRLWQIFEGLCAKCGIRTPALRIIETDGLNAFASGLGEGRYSVTVTRGLVDGLEDDEMEAVLAHELTHIRNHDVRLLVIATVLVGTIPMIHDLIMKAYWALIMGILNLYRAMFIVLPVPFAKPIAEISYGALFLVGKLAAYVIGIVATVCSLVIHFALSREREFMADAGAVEMTGKPNAMMNALRKISGNATLDTAIDGVKAMCFESAAFGWFGIFATHPPIEHRIEAIARLAAPGAVEPIGQQRLDAAATMNRPASLSEPASYAPGRDTSTVERYRLLLLRGRPEVLNIIEREHFYSRVRHAVKNGQQVNVTLTDAQIADALGCLEAAIEQIEAVL